MSRNIAVQMGVYTEDFNLEWFANEYDCNSIGFQKSFEETIGVSPRSKVQLMLWFSDSINDSIVEAKHTNAYNTLDKVIEYYMPQYSYTFT